MTWQAVVTDHAVEVLHAAGWSVGEVQTAIGRQHRWLVYCQRDEERLIVRAPRRIDAWREAVRMANDLDGAD